MLDHPDSIHTIDFDLYSPEYLFPNFPFFSLFSPLVSIHYMLNCFPFQPYHSVPADRVGRPDGGLATVSPQLSPALSDSHEHSRETDGGADRVGCRGANGDHAEHQLWHDHSAGCRDHQHRGGQRADIPGRTGGFYLVFIHRKI